MSAQTSSVREASVVDPLSMEKIVLKCFSLSERRYLGCSALL